MFDLRVSRCFGWQKATALVNLAFVSQFDERGRMRPVPGSLPPAPAPAEHVTPAEVAPDHRVPGTAPDYRDLAKMMFGETGPSVPAKPAPPATAAASARSRLPFDPNWTQMARGRFGEANLPESVALPNDIENGLDHAYKDSLANHGYERGGNLTLTSCGGYQARPGGTNFDDKRNDTTWIPDSHDVGRGQELLGNYHTHVVPETEGTKGSFSDTDVGGFVTSDEKISLLHSGDTNYLIAKTRESEAMFKAQTSDADPESQHVKEMEYSRDLQELWLETTAHTEGNWEQKQEAANRAVAQHYHLGYYEGHGATLNRAPKK